MKSKQECPRCGKELPADAPEGICPACLASAYMQTEVPSPGRVEPMAVEEVAALFPELEILGLLGSGGMGAVYKARQPKLDRLVALKILDRPNGDPRFVERFTREAQTLARLSHPNIVTVHEFGEREGLPFLIMELVDGVTLRSLLRAGKMPPEQALAIVPPICEALQYAHDKQVIHRDIKPENILVDKEGRVKVADFGIARLMEVKEAEEHLTGDAERVGTAHYMAPEQVERPAEVDHRADIYALGVVFYEMLTGELPLGKFPQPSQRVRIDVRLDEVVLKALEKEPEQRYQQASEVETAVTNLSTSSAAGSDAAHAEWKNPDNWTGPKWLSVYFNKRDRRVWVPKQIPGLGWTINLGRPGGVALLFAVIIGLPLIIIGLGIAFYPTNSGDGTDEPGLDASSLEDDLKAERVAEAPFIARLPQGSIELVAVSHHPSDDQPWWRPDGSEYDGPPVYTWGGSSRPFGDERPREFVFRRDDVPDGSDLRIAFDPPSSQAGNIVGFEPGVPDYGLMALSASLRAVTDTVTVKVGAGSGPWRTVAERGTGSGASSITVGDWSVAFASQTEIDGSARVTVAHDIEGHSLRMVAVDVNDETHTSSLSGVGTSGFSAQNATFRGLPLADVVRFEFQVRPYAWAEFRNVSLDPGQSTRVEVVHAQAAGETALNNGPRESLSELAGMEEDVVHHSQSQLGFPDEPVPDSEAATAEVSESSIQGQWQLVSAYENGEAASELAPEFAWTFHFLTNRVVTYNAENEIIRDTSYVKYPLVDPAWIDIIDGDVVGRGIYMIEGDQLTICLPDYGDERRSTAFVSERDPDSPNQTLLKFRRVGPAVEKGAFQIRLLIAAPSDGSETVVFERGDRQETLHLSEEVLVTNEHVTNVTVEKGPNDTYVVLVHFTDAGAEAFADATRGAIGERLAMLVDGRIVMAPRIHQEITDGVATITGTLGLEEAQRIAASIRRQGRHIHEVETNVPAMRKID